MNARNLLLVFAILVTLGSKVLEGGIVLASAVSTTDQAAARVSELSLFSPAIRSLMSYLGTQSHAYVGFMAPACMLPQ